MAKKKTDEVHSSLPLLEAHRSKSGAELVVQTLRGGGSVCYRVTLVDLDVLDDGAFIAIVQGKGTTRVVGRLREETEVKKGGVKGTKDSEEEAVAPAQEWQEVEMNVHVAMCIVSLRGKAHPEVLGVHETDKGARIRLSEDEHSNHLGAHLKRTVVEVELEG